MLTIYTTTNEVRFQTPINKGSKRVYELMGNDNITLKFSVDKPIFFQLGDWCDVPGFGRFELVDLYSPTYNKNTGGYDYEIEFSAYYCKWKNKIFKYTPEVGGREASWSLTATLDVHMSVFLRNLAALGYDFNGQEFVFSIDSTVEQSAKLLTYNNTDMLSALTMMAEAWECEWWVEDNVIYFGRCEFGEAVDFKQGVNVEDISSSANKNVYATRIYAFGSTRNIPFNYRPVDESIVVNGIVQKRLMLPVGTPYVDAEPNMTTESAVEQVVTFDDVYPRTEGLIDFVAARQESVTNDDGTTNTETFYRFKDKTIIFSKDYILPNEELRIVFQSGKLNGMDFGIAFNPLGATEKLSDGSWNPNAQLFEIVASEDYGRKLPDTILKPEVGDKYILHGWDATKIADLGLIANAEAELLEKTNEYIKKTKIDPNTYPCTMMSDWIYERGETPQGFYMPFRLGDRVNLISAAFFDSGSRLSRIIGIECPLDIPYDSPVLTIGETPSTSRLGALEESVEALTIKGQTFTGGGNGGTSVYLIKQNDSTTPTDRNVYSALRALGEFLNKKNPDTAEELIVFLKGLETGLFVEGVKGSQIDEIGNAELESLKVRKGLEANTIVAEKRLTIGAPVVAGVSGGGIWVDEFGNTHLQVDFAEVTKRATFAEVEVKKLRHVGGVMILSAASMECNAVIETEFSYVCYFDTEPAQYPGKQIANEFRVGDLARSQTCNLRQGTTQNAANRYYWRRVINVGDDFIELSKTDCDPAGTNDAPLPGDSIIQMGNVYDPQRQNLIIIAAYGAESPYIYQFQGIDDYTLPDRKCKTRISPYGNRFSGELIVETGTQSQGIADYVSDLSGVYRLVAEVDNVPKTIDGDGNVTDLSLQVKCKAYRIEGGDMKRLTFESESLNFGFLSAGSTLLNLGGSLLRLGDGEEPELLTMTRTYYRQDSAKKQLVEKQTSDYDASSSLVLADDVAKVVFTLWRNGEKVAEAAVDGSAQLNLTRTRFSVLDDRITSEVEQIGESISTIEQTASAISLKVDKVNSATSANLAKGTTQEATRFNFAANNLVMPLLGISVVNPRQDITLTFDFLIKTTFIDPSQLGQTAYGFLTYIGGVPFNGWNNLSQMTAALYEGKVAYKGTFSKTIPAAGMESAPDEMDIALQFRNSPVFEFIEIKNLRVNLGSTALPWQPYAGETSERLRATGIDIEHKKIKLTADNVEILNNAGKPTATFDQDGEFCAHRVIARNSAGNIVAAMNAYGQGEYTMYYPSTGKRRLQISPSADRDQAMVYYDTDGTTPIWTLGASGISYLVEQKFVKVSGYYYSTEGVEAPLYQFVASENSNNREYNGLYFTKDQSDLTQNRASGTYLALTTEPDATGQKRHYMKFSNGKLTEQGYVPA